jgi:hypothetical protein
MFGHLDVVRLLLDRGAKVDAANKEECWRCPPLPSNNLGCCVAKQGARRLSRLLAACMPAGWLAGWSSAATCHLPATWAVALGCSGWLCTWSVALCNTPVCHLRCVSCDAAPCMLPDLVSCAW